MCWARGVRLLTRCARNARVGLSDFIRLIDRDHRREYVGQDSQTGSGMSEIVSLYEAKTHLSQLVDRAADGEEIIISKNGVAMARLAPIAFNGERRKPAGALGVTSIAEDFDAPLPDDLQAAFDGKA
jgi:prevent-host-death family protein